MKLKEHNRVILAPRNATIACHILSISAEIFVQPEQPLIANTLLR